MQNIAALDSQIQSLNPDQLRMVLQNNPDPTAQMLAGAALQRMSKMMPAGSAGPPTTVKQDILNAGIGTLPMEPVRMNTGGNPLDQYIKQQERAREAVGGRYAELALPRLTLEEAVAQAEGLMGPDPMADVRRMMEAYAGEGAQRRDDRITDLLLSVGTGLMNAKSPNFLSALGQGVAGLPAAVSQMRSAEGADRRGAIEDQFRLANSETGRRNRVLEAGIGERNRADQRALQIEGLISGGAAEILNLQENERNRRNNLAMRNVSAQASSARQTLANRLPAETRARLENLERRAEFEQAAALRKYGALSSANAVLLTPAQRAEIEREVREHERKAREYHDQADKLIEMAFPGAALSPAPVTPPAQGGISALPAPAPAPPSAPPGGDLWLRRSGSIGGLPPPKLPPTLWPGPPVPPPTPRPGAPVGSAPDGGPVYSFSAY